MLIELDTKIWRMGGHYECELASKANSICIAEADRGLIEERRAK